MAGFTRALSPRLFSPPDFCAARKSSDILRTLCSGRHDDGEESVFNFAARRIGRAAAETFVDPMVSGIFGGWLVSCRCPSCFPVMREMELRHGGLVKAMIADNWKNGDRE